MLIINVSGFAFASVFVSGLAAYCRLVVTSISQAEQQFLIYRHTLYICDFFYKASST